MGLVQGRASALSCPGLQGSGVEGWSQLSKQGSEVTEVGGRAASRRDREAETPAQARKERAEEEMAQRQRRPGRLWERRPLQEGLPFPPRLTGSGTGALGAGWWRRRRQLRRFGSEADWVRASGGRQVRVARMTGPPRPALLPWGWGVCACPPASVTSPSPSSLCFSSRLHPSGSVSLHLWRLLPFCNSVAIFLLASLCLCLSVFLSVSLSVSL